MRLVRLMLPFSAIFCLLLSCNLRGRSIFSQIGHFEKVDYNSTSPLYKSSTSGVAFANESLFVTGSRRLWRQDSQGKWTDLTYSLPVPFNAVVDIVQLNLSGKIYLALSNTQGTNLGLFELETTDCSFKGIGPVITGQQPNFFFKIQDKSGAITRAYLYAQDSGDSPHKKYVYALNDPSLKNIGPLDENGNPPDQYRRIIAPMDEGVTYVVTHTFNQSEQSQIWDNSGKSKPINIYPNYPVRLAGQFPLRVKNSSNYASALITVATVSILSGKTFAVDLKTGKLNTDPQQMLEGLSGSVQPNTYAYIDEIPVITSNFGYFESNEGKNLIFPSDKTTNVLSYTAGRFSSMNVRGIYKTANKGKVYLTTWSKGLWERDPATKKWKSV